MLLTEGSTLLGLVHQNSMGCQRCISQACHLDPSLKYRFCDLWNIKGTIQNLEALSRKISSSCAEQSRIFKTTRRHQTGTRWHHNVLWCKGTIYISAYETCTEESYRNSWKKTKYFRKEPPWQWITSPVYWSFVWPALISPSKKNFMNRWKGLLWVLLLVP